MSDAVRDSGRDAVFQPELREDLHFWVKTDRRTAPEPLRHLGGDVWSRRITQEHRLVYEVSADRIDFLQARHHY